MQNHHEGQAPEFKPEPKHALLIGATGATGKDLLDLLLKDDDISLVLLLSGLIIDEGLPA